MGRDMAEGVDRVLTLAEAQTMQDQGHAAAWIVTGIEERISV